jgi:hypothetical protein
MITLGPSLTGLRGTQVTGSITYTLVTRGGGILVGGGRAARLCGELCSGERQSIML